ncbi:MAG: tetratricopeptide repeat protein, partial [Vibrio ordalii]|uniref:tetratricopeptide repeat protein n=1 Tax=Vibrio ordalii TaxID=28174 RepID=UPI003F2BEADD
MSAINDALSKLAQAQRQSVVNLQLAQVAKVKRSRAWLWMVAGFAASLAVGGWAVSQQQAMVNQAAVDQAAVDQTMVNQTAVNQTAVNQTMASQTGPNQTIVSQTVVSQTLANQAIVNEPESLLLEVDERSSSPALVSPTTKIVTEHRPVYQTAAVPVAKKTASSVTPTVTVKQDSALANQQPLHSNRAVALGAESGQEISSVLIEQVDLTPEQLAGKAMRRADKAVDSNELKEALDAYSEVLRFTPDNELARQKLSALYYGKGDARKAFEILQSGIKLNHNGESLRIALAKLL